MGGARPRPFTLFTITYKVAVAVYDPAEKADTLTLFHLYPYMVLCGPITRFIQDGERRTCTLEAGINSLEKN